MARMTSRELGAIIDRSESYASLIRRGLRTPSMEVFLKLVRHFDLNREAAILAMEAGPETFGFFLEHNALDPQADQQTDQADAEPESAGN
jgi:hypothetical protein